MTEPLMSVEGLSAGYGSAVVLQNVSLSLVTGSLVTVIGANGAGKTTLLNSLIGLLPSKGAIRFGGASIIRKSVEQRVSEGLALVPERRELFSDMSIEDNLMLGGFGCSRVERAQTLASVLELFPRLRERYRQLAGTLSGGERQMLAMGRALMARPKLLMLDEPSLGLAPKIIQDIFDLLVRLRQSGVTILLVEQNARAALKIADYAYVVELGRITAAGTPREIEQDQRLVESYLGYGKNAY